MQWQLWTGKCPDVNWAPLIPSLCKDPQQFSIPSQHLLALPAPAAFSLNEAKPREIVLNACSKRIIMLKVKAFSCFLARVYVSTRRVFTYADRGDRKYFCAAHIPAHLHTMPNEPSSAAEKLQISGAVYSVCNLIDHTEEATSWSVYSCYAWERGCISAVFCPSECHSLQRACGSAARCSPI